jgi:uncharacterized protein
MTTVSTRPRQLAPDLARGGLLAMIAVANAGLYLYGRPYGVRQHIAETGLLDRVVAVVQVTLVDSRAYPMFAALFAYGIAASLRRRVDAGVDPREARRAVRRRNAWLIAFGFVHAMLLFPGDILGLYGALGFAVLGFTRLRDRTLLALAVGWLAVVAVLQGFSYSPPPSTQRTFMLSLVEADPLRALAGHPVDWLLSPFGLVGVLSAMLVGVWAARRDVAADLEAHRDLLVRVAVAGIGIAVLGGLPAGLAVGEFWTPDGFGARLAVSGVHAVTGVAGGLGYAALVGLIAARIGQRRGPVVRAVAACGERSLSCYLFQSVAFVILLKPYTFGLGGVLGSAATAGLALAVWLVSVLLADALARAGRPGPAEALMRRLTRR